MTESIWDYFKKEPQMTGAQIAKELNVTRMNVSQMLKRAMAKLYAEMCKEEPEMDPFERAVQLSKILGVNFSDETEMKKFYKLFPLSIRKKINEDAQRHRTSK